MDKVNTYMVEIAVGNIATMDIEVDENSETLAIAAALNVAASLMKPDIRLEANGVTLLS